MWDLSSWFISSILPGPTNSRAQGYQELLFQKLESDRWLVGIKMDGVPNGGFCGFWVFFFFQPSYQSVKDNPPLPLLVAFFCFQNGSCSESLWEKQPELCCLRNLAERKPSRKMVLFFFKLWFSLVRLSREHHCWVHKKVPACSVFFSWVPRIQVHNAC